MKGLSGPQDSGAWRFLWLCALCALVLGGFVVALGSSLPHETRRVISDVGLIAASLVGVGACSYRRQQFAGRRRRAWTLFAMASGFAAACNTYVLGVHLLRLPDWWSVYSAPALFAALACGLVGLTQFSALPRRLSDLARMLCDCIVLSGGLFLVSVALYPTILTSHAENPLALVLPLIDVGVAAYALLIFVRVSVADRTVLAFLCVGSGLYGVFDFTFVVLTAEQPGFDYGSPLDVGWMTGSLLIALAALHPAAARPAEGGRSIELSPKLGTVLIYLLVFGAALLSVRDGTNRLDTSSVIWLAMVLAVAARQLLLIIDNDTLQQSLELMVADRTLELEHAITQSDLLLSSVGEGIYGVDRGGLVTFVNPAGARALGATADELIGSDAHRTFHAAREDGSAFPRESCYVTEAIRHGSVTSAEEDVYTRHDGGRFPVEVTATPLTSDDYVRGAVVVFRDITQRLEVDRLKKEFVSMVSHELRTPLTSMRGSLGLLAGGALGPLPAGGQRMVTLALDSCARLTRLINDILDIERMESGTMPMEIARHEVATLIDAATSQLQVIAAAAGVTLLVSHADGVVDADSDRVIQTLINLVDNAIKFSPPGSTVDVAAEPSGDLVEFTVRDQGRGIPADKLDTIFGRFEQVDSSDARDKGGSGLGLAISRSMVERLGGRIWATNSLGAGATFRFTLPRSAPGPESLATAGAVPHQVGE